MLHWNIEQRPSRNWDDVCDEKVEEGSSPTSPTAVSVSCDDGDAFEVLFVMLGKCSSTFTKCIAPDVPSSSVGEHQIDVHIVRASADNTSVGICRLSERIPANDCNRVVSSVLQRVQQQQARVIVCTEMVLSSFIGDGAQDAKVYHLSSTAATEDQEILPGPNMVDGLAAAFLTRALVSNGALETHVFCQLRDYQVTSDNLRALESVVQSFGGDFLAKDDDEQMKRVRSRYRAAVTDMNRSALFL